MSQVPTRANNSIIPEEKRLKLAGLCGVAAPIVALSCIFIAISLSPWFNWSANALSDLGIGEAAWVFNLGLMAGGILSMVFVVGMFSPFNDSVRRLGTLVFFLGALSLVGIGAFSEAAGRIHFYFSVAFFVLVPISLLLIGAGFVLTGSRKFGVLTVVIGVLAALPWAFSWSSVAVPELLSALASTAWSAIQGARFYLGRL
ncbi:MAG: DUF998 domain-containing protein [Methanobacteriota archaeon]